MRIMKKIYAILAAVTLILLAAAISACTSSSTNVSTNRSYDQDYTKSSSSRTASDRAGREGFPEEMYVPPITLSLVAMNTGELLAGESYPIVAVVDNPENRDLRYRWSVEDGKLANLPESLRSEMVSFESQVRTNKGANAPAAGAPIPPAEGAAPATPPAGAPAGAAAAPPPPRTEGAPPAAAKPPALPGPGVKEQPPAVEKPAGEAPAEAGAVEAAATGEFLRDLYIFVLPSLAEGFSNSLIEAMARGCPAIATTVGANPEVIADGENGFLVPPGEERLLAERLEQLARDPELRCRLGRAGRKRVEKSFSVEAMRRSYRDLYNECA